MNRLLSSVTLALRLSFRSGFTALAWTTSLIWIGMMSRISQPWVENHGALLLATPLFLQILWGMAWQIAREQGEGTFAFLRVTPLRPHEYLAAKVGSGLAITLIPFGVMSAYLHGFHFTLVFQTLGLVTLVALATLVAFWVAVRFAAARKRVLVMLCITVFGLIPWLPPLRFPLGYGVYVHPLQASLTLLEAPGHPASIGPWFYGVGYGFFCLAVALVFCKRVLAQR